jgi:soluble lytic murein transglycosylase-like protein
MKLFYTFLFVLTLYSNASAQNFCFADAEQYYNIDRRILYAISLVESGGKNSAIRHPTKTVKSTDKGHMQINSWWGFKDSELEDPCFQTLAGAAILSDCFKRYGNGPDSLSCYNTGKSLSELPLDRKQKAKEYIGKIYDVLLK